MSGPVNRESSDACSRWRKAALRELSRRHRADYRLFYSSVRAEGYRPDVAKGRAMTLLRSKYPGSYAVLYDAAKRAAMKAQSGGRTAPPNCQASHATADVGEFENLLERSSLGRPGARMLRARTSRAEARAIIAMIPPA